MTKGRSLINREGGIKHREHMTINGPDPIGRIAITIYDGPRVAMMSTTADKLRTFVRHVLGDP